MVKKSGRGGEEEDEEEDGEEERGERCGLGTEGNTGQEA